MSTFGVDYARVDGHKHPIGFDLAFAAGVRFAILRGSWGTVQDSIVKRDRDALRAANIAAGAYMFLRYPSKLAPVVDPETQARTFIASVGALEPGDLPPSLDVEFPGVGRTGTVLSARQAIEWAERAYDTLRQVYTTVMVYTSSRVWHEDLLDMPSKLGNESPLWCKTPYFWKVGHVYDPSHARPVTLPKPWAGEGPGCWFQQVQGDATGLPGFSSTVDINLFLGMQAGEKSSRVRWVQGKTGAELDGDFGPNTGGAVRRFQYRAGLTPTGIVDVETFAALCA